MGSALRLIHAGTIGLEGLLDVAPGILKGEGITVAKKITVYYWGPCKMNIYGRGIGIYLTLDTAGVAYEMKGPDDMVPKFGAAGENTQAMAMPVIDLDGLMIGQAPAILAVLGKMFSLGGKTQQEQLACHQALHDMNDIFGEKRNLKDNPQRKEKWFTYLEKKYTGKKWLAGTSEPTVADFHGVFAFEWLNKVAGRILVDV